MVVVVAVVVGGGSGGDSRAKPGRCRMILLLTTTITMPGTLNLSQPQTALQFDRRGPWYSFLIGEARILSSKLAR